ncbi:helix-turn-helix domain-containing protein [Cloacibacillus porcorum]|uniref:helix-turn-helix domain-containing protein n=1 Tax=Cloacibacillus porcorum TaxID=1197717 RepID=UPI0023F16DE1|nr:helix-turn-helix transcriptional regulator [Cloacibacillus porcorum]MDD7649046.1 helix-turn-helix transcriptional regulator [Cloacibacillus porcorum]MDY4094547.1 helix-turn-helix transcriptional regulator [Cloacibacillus porcorum]
MDEKYEFRNIGLNIKKLRGKKGWTQAVFAEKLDVSIGYISEIETGRRMPSFKRINKMIKLLCCTPNELLLDTFATDPSGDKMSHDNHIYENIDDTITAVIEMMQRMSPEEKFKVFRYAKDQEYLSEYFKIINNTKN